MESDDQAPRQTFWWQRPLHEIEEDAILRTLADCDGNKAKAAARLKIALKTIYNKWNDIQARQTAARSEINGECRGIERALAGGRQGDHDQGDC